MHWLSYWLSSFQYNTVMATGEVCVVDGGKYQRQCFHSNLKLSNKHQHVMTNASLDRGVIVLSISGP
jgi:hypothetical protein